jgi:hypothetical protein
MGAVLNSSNLVSGAHANLLVSGAQAEPLVSGIHVEYKRRARLIVAIADWSACASLADSEF